MEKLREFLGAGYEITANDPAVLAWSSPTGEWRIGAFEVTRLDPRALLYSKLEYGRHLVDNREIFDNWAATTLGA